ncbi:hypothetical protein FFLO_06415 [Filobasidium floriforme]|uniref:Found in mitochondrial proteome protein 51 n=1 Tax=Filobasidium floriforme TaxID=5210 RepID=A0A8K0NQH1_9TREE|nr:uncharacterized protein HD553DRAFT_319231 [Filobasidium floriforme]KAG7528101.1 hypothetical protein FFLO_06415 [Filobasidium floriforme]KAH8079036.1 hypothetical protein HD553DRAFT_319231 [Filobasidium floriforme]
MTAIVAGPLLGGLVGSAVYYTISQTISNRTSLIRSELHDCAVALSAHSSSNSSFTQSPTPTSSQLSHPYPHYRPLSDQLRTRWNSILEKTVTGVETTDWQNVLGGVWDAASGVVHRVTTNTFSPRVGEEESSSSSFGYSVAPREGVVDALKHKLHDIQASTTNALESALHSHQSSSTSSTSTPSNSVRKDVEFVKQKELALATTLRDGKIPGSLNDPLGKRVEKALGVDDVGSGRMV